MWDVRYQEELNQKRDAARQGGGSKRIAAQHRKGKLTARERVDLLFDPGTFIEVGQLIESRIDDFGAGQKRVPGDGVVTGYGLVNGRTVYVSSEDFTVIGGTLGEYHSKKICRIMDMALEMKAPYLSINDSGGARIEEGICSLDGYSGIFYRNTRASGVIPQIAVIMGPCAGGACYSPAICDFIFMTEQTGHMFITGPGVVKEVIGEEVSAEELGGARMHTEKSGVTHFSCASDEECLEKVRRLLSYLPQNSREQPPRLSGKARDRSLELESLVPDNQRMVYDVTKVIETLADEDSFLEIQSGYAKSMVVGFLRMDTEVIGMVANQPLYLGGSIDCEAAEKAARFIRFCDCFNIPLLTLVDVPGFLPGSRQEQGGIIRRGAKMLYAFSEATVPKVSLIMRKAYGGAYIAMNSKGMAADVVYAWPIAQIAVMGAEGAVDIMFRQELADHPEARKARVEEYNRTFMSPYLAAARGYIDDVILPGETRKKIRAAFEALRGKSPEEPYKKHGNIPL